MKIREINSLNNLKIKQVLKLRSKKYRNLERKFVIEGLKEIKLANEANLILEIFTIKEELKNFLEFKANFFLVNKKILANISQHTNPSIAIAICKIKDQFEINYFRNSKRLIILENIQNPGNLGAIIRNCVSFNIDIVYSGVDLYNPKTISAAKGTIFQINIYHLKNIFEFFAFPFKQKIIAATTEKTSIPLNNFKIELNKSYCIIFGSEGKGISEKLIKLANVKLYIPINFNSLNIASAVAIFCHFFSNFSRKN